MKKLKLLLCLLFFLCVFPSYAHTNYLERWRKTPLYLGALLGFGSTDWSMLIAHCDIHDISCANVLTSAPIDAGDTGAVWGFFLGYEIQSHFALEATFYQFPTTNVKFYIHSIYRYKYHILSFNSITYAYTLVGKFMVQIANTGLRGFANAGMALTHRHDVLTTTTHVNPTFGVGLNYVFPKQIMLELAFQYIAGYGKANVQPAFDYMPFLYAITAQVAYRFAV